MYNYNSETLAYNMQINRSIYRIVIAIDLIYEINL